MDSQKTVTKYVPQWKGNLEWEIEDVSLHFKKCDSCWSGMDHPRYDCSPSDTFNMNSPTMQLSAGDGKQSKWHFVLQRNTNGRTKDFLVKLRFDGLFGSDGLKIDEPLNLKYSAVVEISGLGKIEILKTADGKYCSDPENLHRTIYYQQIRVVQLKRGWPNGNLRISAEITHLSNIKNEVLNNRKFLDLINFKDDLPLASCYGNLFNNPDMSDFKIICDGSSFHAHKFILSVRSRVFRAMIESGLSESTRNELKIEDMTVKTVEFMLEFIYKGAVEIFPENLKEKIELLDCAEKYELEGLKSMCMRKIFSSLPTEKEVGELAMAAFTYGAKEGASKGIKDFCTMNHAKLIQSPEYKKAFLANPRAFIN